MLAKISFKALNYHNFHIFIITNFKTNRYLNYFQEHLVGILRLRNTKCHFKISVPREDEAVKHDLFEFKVQVFCCHGNKSTVLLFYSIVSEELWPFSHKDLIFWLPNFGLFHFSDSLRTPVPLASYIRNSLRFWYYASLSTCCQNLEKNWGNRENLGESGCQTFKGSDREMCQF